MEQHLQEIESKLHNLLPLVEAIDSQLHGMKHELENLQSSFHSLKKACSGTKDDSPTRRRSSLDVMRIDVISQSSQSKPPSAYTRIFTLTHEIWIYLCEFIDTTGIARLSRTCRHMQMILSESDLWKSMFFRLFRNPYEFGHTSALSGQKLPSLASQSVQAVLSASVLASHPHAPLIPLPTSTSSPPKPALLRAFAPDPHIDWKIEVAARVKACKNWSKCAYESVAVAETNDALQFVQFDATRLLVSSANVLREWSTDTWFNTASYSVPGGCTHFSFFDNDLVVGSPDGARVYDTDTKKLKYTLPVQSQVHRVKVTPVGGRIMLGLWNGFVQIYDVATGTHVTTLTGHQNPIAAMDYYQYGSDVRILTGSSDKTMKLWDVQTGICIGMFKGHTKTVNTCQLSRSLIASGSRDTTIRLFDVRTSSCVKIFYDHHDAVNCVQFDEDKLVSCSKDKTIKVFSMERRAFLCTLSNKPATTAHSGNITSLQFDDKKILSCGEDKTIKAWFF